MKNIAQMKEMAARYHQIKEKDRAEISKQWKAEGWIRILAGIMFAYGIYYLVSYMHKSSWWWLELVFLLLFVLFFACASIRAIIGGIKELRGGDKNEQAYYKHLRWLSDFFYVLLPDLDHLDRNALDIFIRAAYSEKGITKRTKFTKLAPEDYPTIFDLCAVIEKHSNEECDGVIPPEISRSILSQLNDYYEEPLTGPLSFWNKSSKIERKTNDDA